MTETTSKVLVIVSAHLVVLCLQWPWLLARIGGGFVALANLLGRVGVRVLVREEPADPPLPPARVVQR